MQVWSEFKAFLLRANVLALALAFIVGVALASVIASLVNDILMPPIGLLLGGVDFQSMFVDLSGKQYPTLKAAKDAGAATINYGVFLNSVITLVIVSFVVFLIARTFVREVPPAATKTCPRCRETILAAATRCPHCTSDLAYELPA